MSLNILSVDVRYLPLAEWVRIALALMWRRRHGAVNSAMPSRIGIVNEGLSLQAAGSNFLRC